MPMATQPDATCLARKLLVELAHWESLRAADDSQSLKSTGEDNARVIELRRQLAALGARFHFEADGYVLDGMDENGSARP